MESWLNMIFNNTPLLVMEMNNRNLYFQIRGETTILDIKEVQELKDALENWIVMQAEKQLPELACNHRYSPFNKIYVCECCGKIK